MCAKTAETKENLSKHIERVNEGEKKESGTVETLRKHCIGMCVDDSQHSFQFLLIIILGSD